MGEEGAKSVYTKTEVDAAIDADIVTHAALTATHGVSGAILGTEDVDDTPVDGETTVPPSSNWAYDHAINYLLHNKLIRKTADEIVTNSAVLQADDELLFAIGANEVWEIELLLLTLSVTTTPNVKFQVTVPSGGNAYFRLQYTNTAAGQAVSWFEDGDQVSIDATNAIMPGAVVHGVIVNGSTAGNVQLNWCQDTQTNEATTLKANSFILARRLA